MEDTVYKTIKAEIKDVDKEEGTVETYIPVSSDSVDRDGEVVEPQAFKKTLPKFMKRPVLVSSHDYRDLTSQIGEWKRLRVTDDGLEGKPQWYINEGNEQADWGFNLASKGMAAFSIGFIPKKWTDGDGEKEPRRTYNEVELLEISQVIIPSNREAIQGIRAKSADPTVLEICDEVEKELEPEEEDAEEEQGEDKDLSTDDVPTTPELVTKPEETEEYIHIPVKDAGQFQGDSFRTINIDKEQGIKAVIGKLTGETKTTVQKYMFDKSKGWTMAKAKKWVKDHEKSIILIEPDESKSVIPYKKYPLDESGGWDAAREVAKAEVEDLKKMCTIVVGDPENKTSYKLPHHRADGYTTVWAGVRAAAAVLMGARGGVDAPASDIAGAKSHIGKHYKDFDKGEPPWDKTVSQEEIRDEIDYLRFLVEKDGLSAETAEVLRNFVIETLKVRLPENDISVDTEKEDIEEPTPEEMQEAFQELLNVIQNTNIGGN